MPFHLNTVYFQWFRKRAPRIRSFVFGPLSGAFVHFTFKFAILFIVLTHVICIEQEYLLREMENWNALNKMCVCGDVTRSNVS